MGILPGRLDEEMPHFDWFIVLFLLVVMTIPTLSVKSVNVPLLGVISGSQAIAYVTAISAIAALYRLRKPNQPAPKVLPAFEPMEDSDLFDFGLQNHGPGAALYLQIKIVDEERGNVLYQNEPLEHPVHLEEGDFVGFVYGNTADDKLRSILQAESDENLEGEVGLYFSYKSPSGARVPQYMDGEMERADSEVLDALEEIEDTPRRMGFSELYENCAE